MRYLLPVLVAAIVTAGVHVRGEDGRTPAQPPRDAESDAEIYLLGADARPADDIYGEQPYGDATGHEAWIGCTSSIFFSTGADATTKGNIWTAKVGDKKPTLVHEGKRFGHVSVSRDGKYWIGDTGEKDIPIYVGSFATGRCKRACFSFTEYDGKQCDDSAMEPW